jgi:hypothetical protein
VLVEDESELRAGMAVQARPCPVCRETDTAMLFDVTGRSYCNDCGVLTPDINAMAKCGSGVICWRATIRDGHLFRLIDLPPDAEASEETHADVFERMAREMDEPRRLTTTNAGGKR